MHQSPLSSESPAAPRAVDRARDGEGRDVDGARRDLNLVPGTAERQRLAFLLADLDLDGVQKMTLALAGCLAARGYSVDPAHPSEP